MVTRIDFEKSNIIESTFLKDTLNRGLILNNSLFNILKEDNSKNVKYDFDVYLPKFKINLQRPYVWKDFQQKDFILSLLYEKPIEKVIAIRHEDVEGNVIFYIIDGKQRLLTIKKFINNEFPIVINNKIAFFKDFDRSASTWFKRKVDSITADIFYSYDNVLISDEDKIKIFNFYNFSGTPQLESYKLKLESLLNKDQNN